MPGPGVQTGHLARVSGTRLCCLPLVSSRLDVLAAFSWSSIEIIFCGKVSKKALLSYGRSLVVRPAGRHTWEVGVADSHTQHGNPILFIYTKWFYLYIDLLIIYETSVLRLPGLVPDTGLFVRLRNVWVQQNTPWQCRPIRLSSSKKLRRRDRWRMVSGRHRDQFETQPIALQF